jgi:hypothetical protein
MSWISSMISPDCVGPLHLFLILFTFPHPEVPSLSSHATHNLDFYPATNEFIHPTNTSALITEEKTTFEAKKTSETKPPLS